MVRNGALTNVEWCEVQIGEVCFIENEEMLPTDLILLSSFDSGGVAFI